jgi:hypothetical protein
MPRLSIEPTARRMAGALMKSTTRSWQSLLRDGPGQDRQAKQVARQDAHRSANGERDVDARFRQIKRNLAARVAEADDEHAFASEWRRIAVAARMQDRSAERLRAGPGRGVRKVGEASRNDDNGRRGRLVSGLCAPEAPVAPDRADGCVEDRLKIELRRVSFKIFDHLCARWVAAVGGRHRQTRQARMPAIGVQMQPVVVAPPDRADRIGFFQNDRVQTAHAHAGRSGESRRSSADDDRIACSRHELSSFKRMGMGSVQRPNQCDIAVPTATPARAAATPIGRLALLVSGNQTDVD